MLTICQNLIHFNPFQANASFSYSLKTLGSLRTVCRGVNTPPPISKKIPHFWVTPISKNSSPLSSQNFQVTKFQNFQILLLGLI